MNVIDMHCDTLGRIRELRRAGGKASLRDGAGLRVTLEKMREGQYLLQNFAVFIDLKEAPGQPYASAMELVRIFEEEMAANRDLIRPVTRYEDFLENERAGRMSALLTLEEGGICLGETARLREFYRCGARMMTLGWNYENDLCFPSALQQEHAPGYQRGERRPLGLKEKGFEILEEMGRLGMIVDVSHLSDDGFFDVWEHTEKPFVASHSNSRALCPHRRNLTDEMLRMLGERGCVAGLNYFPEFLLPGPTRTAPTFAGGRVRPAPPQAEATRFPLRDAARTQLLLRLADHALHMMDVGGSGCVGLGSDFDGFGPDSAPGDASQVQDLAWALHRRGASDRQIDGILQGNVRRVYREVLIG